MKTIQTTRQRVKNLILTLNNAVSSGFSSDVVERYQIQLISLLVEQAQDNYKRRARALC